MAVYFVTGKLGSGKTLCAVGKIKDYLSQSRRVATNLDLHLENMFFDKSVKCDVTRLPDKPRLEDLQIIGKGCEEENENKYGLIVLDELGTWFNSRNWRDKERLPVIDWFLHARKYHWDIFFIVQDIDSLDSQLVNALCEHYVKCSRTDRLTIPYIGWIFKWIGFNKVLPKVHVASVYYGQTSSGLRVDRWIYRAKDLYSSYNTSQRFSDQYEHLNGDYYDMRATYTLLSPYYLNKIQLIQLYQQKIESLTVKEMNKNARPTDGHFYSFHPLFKQTIIPIALVVFSLIYINRPAQSKVDIFHNSNIDPNQKNLQISKIEDKVPAQTLKSIVPIKDSFSQLLEGNTISVTSHYQFEGNYEAILHISTKDGEVITSLRDARASGYIVTKTAMEYLLTKGDYVIKVPFYNYKKSVPDNPESQTDKTAIQISKS